MSRSSAYVWTISVYSVNFTKYGRTRLTVIVSTLVPLVVAGAPGGITTGVVFEKLLRRTFGAPVKVEMSSDQDVKLPVFVARSSVIVSVQTPLGFSPRKFSSRPSGAMGVAATPFT